MTERGYVLMSGDADEYDTYPLGVVDDEAGAAWVEQYGDGGVVQPLPRVVVPRCERHDVLVLYRRWSIVGDDTGTQESTIVALHYPEGLPVEHFDSPGQFAEPPPPVECGLYPYESEYTLRAYARAHGTDHAAVRAAFADTCEQVERDGIAATIVALWVPRGIPAWAWSPPPQYGPAEQGRILREHGATP